MGEKFPEYWKDTGGDDLCVADDMKTPEQMCNVWWGFVIF